MKKIIASFALPVLFMFTASHSFASTASIDMATTNTMTVELRPWSATSSSYSYGSVINPASDMNVNSFSFQMRKFTSNDTVAQPYIAYIYESNSSGILSGSAIAQSNEEISTNSSSLTEVKAELTSTVTLSSGSYYTLIFNVVGVSGADSNDSYHWLMSNVVESQAAGIWFSNDSSDGISNPTFLDSLNFALKVYEGDVAVVIESRGTGPGGKDLNYSESIAYFGLTAVQTLFPGPNSPVSKPTVIQ